MDQRSLCSLLVFALVHVAFANLDCHRLYTVHSNHYLENPVRIEMIDDERNLVTCASKCQRDRRCVSLNYGDDKICELNTNDVIGGQSNLTYRERSTYLELDWQRIVNNASTYFIFTPTVNEKTRMNIHIGYNGKTDQYNRISNYEEIISNWNATTFSTNNVLRYRTFVPTTPSYTTPAEATTAPNSSRTVLIPNITDVPESQTNSTSLEDMYSYLHREFNNSAAELSWQFNFSGTILRIVDVDIRGTTNLHYGGDINYYVCDNNGTCVDGSGVNVHTSVFHGSDTLNVTITMTGDNDQYPILFPVSIYDPDGVFSFDIHITMMDGCE